MRETVRVRLSGGGVLPRYASPGAAGADLCAAESVIVGPGERAAVGTALEIELPPGTVGLVWPRSGLAVRHGVDTLAGVVDSDYRGEVKVVLINHGREPFHVLAGDRIAQLLVQRVEQIDFAVESDLTATARGAGGFGSTGA